TRYAPLLSFRRRASSPSKASLQPARWLSRRAPGHVPKFLVLYLGQVSKAGKCLISRRFLAIWLIGAAGRLPRTESRCQSPLLSGNPAVGAGLLETAPTARLSRPQNALSHLQKP